MIPLLIIHPDIEVRREKIEEILKSHGLFLNHPNVLYLNNEQKLGIETVSKILGHLNLKPYQKGPQSVVLESAEDLTPEAQNSLLKTLEEGAEESLFILAAKYEDALLPTIISRCQTETLESTTDYSSESVKKYQPIISNLISLSVEERFKFVEKLNEKEDFLRALVIFFHQELIKNPDSAKIKDFLIDLTKAEKYWSYNVNQRAIIEYLMLKFPSKF